MDLLADLSIAICSSYFWTLLPVFSEIVFCKTGGGIKNGSILILKNKLFTWHATPCSHGLLLRRLWRRLDKKGLASDLVFFQDIISSPVRLFSTVHFQIFFQDLISWQGCPPDAEDCRKKPGKEQERPKPIWENWRSESVTQFNDITSQYVPDYNW